VRRWLSLLLGSIALAAFGALGLTLFVEREAEPRFEVAAGPPPGAAPRAIVLFHPSRDAGFSDDLSAALRNGLTSAGFAVDRATITSATPAAPKDYALIAVVSNTYWWTPDRPTLHYLARARFDGIPALGLIGGAGSTERSQRKLDEALRATGAKVIRTQSFWLWRPNDERRMEENNRAVALDQARQLGTQTAAALRQP
jgi:hypothetical protein